MSLWKNLLDRMAERRRKGRQPAPQLAVYYWTNAAPVGHPIRDISSTGLYLITDERWYPGTLVTITLQRTDEPGTAEDSGIRSISVQSKAVRWGDDGVGLEFMLAKKRDRNHGTDHGNADRRLLEKFLAGFQPERGRAIVNPAQVELGRQF